MTHLPRLASLVFDRPHFITPQAGRAIAGVISAHRGLDLRMEPERPSPEANRFIGNEEVQRDEQGNVVRNMWGDPIRLGYRISGSVAIVNMLGEFVNRGAWVDARSGLMSYEGIKNTLTHAATNPRVKGMLFDVNSPGGEAGGMTEAAALVRKIAAEMPVAAVANTLMCSAAYGLCSGARRIVTTELGNVGSIGVVVMHADYSQALEDDGIKITLIHEGAHKVDGNPFEPLPEAVRSAIQAECGKYMSAFVAAVAAGRTQLTSKQIRDTQARVFLGRESVEAGLADSVGTFEEVLADLESAAQGRSVFAPPRRGAASATQVASNVDQPEPAAAPAMSISAPTLNRENPMSTPQATTDKTHTKADLDAAVVTATATAKADERARVKSIMTHAAAAGQPKLAEHLAYETDQSADAACAMLAAASPSAKPSAPAPAAAAPAAPATVLGGLELAAPAENPAAKPSSNATSVPSAASVYARRRSA